jgi:outer membrane protein TolC
VRRREPFLAACIVFLGWICASARQLGPIALSPEQAVSFALERSLVLKAARFGPQIAAGQVAVANTAWSPQLSSRTSVTNSHTPPLSVFDARSGLVTRELSATAGVGQLLPWGSSYSVQWDGERLSGSNGLALFNPQLTAGASVTFTQHFLRGLRIDEARANRLISLKSRSVSESELASAVAATTQSVLRAYWSWIYAREYLAVEKQSIELAEGLLRDDRVRATVGKIAAVDVVEVEAEVARRSDVILSATKDVANAEDRLRLLIFAPLDPEQRLALEPPPSLEPVFPASPPEEIITRALALRQDLRILQAALDIDDITVKRLRDEVLPDVALSSSYAGRGFAGNQVRPSLVPGGFVTGSGPQGFASTLGDLARFRYPSWSAELTVNLPLGKSQATAEAARAAIQRQQDAATLMSAEQQASTEIKTIYRSADANRQRLPITANAVTLAERRLDAEQRKFLVGLSTSFLVIQAQRDLTATREQQLASVLDYRLSLADLEAVQTIPVR